MIHEPQRGGDEASGGTRRAAGLQADLNEGDVRGGNICLDGERAPGLYRSHEIRKTKISSKDADKSDCLRLDGKGFGDLDRPRVGQTSPAHRSTAELTVDYGIGPGGGAVLVHAEGDRVIRCSGRYARRGDPGTGCHLAISIELVEPGTPVIGTAIGEQVGRAGFSRNGRIQAGKAHRRTPVQRTIVNGAEVAVIDGVPVRPVHSLVVLEVTIGQVAGPSGGLPHPHPVDEKVARKDRVAGRNAVKKTADGRVHDEKHRALGNSLGIGENNLVIEVRLDARGRPFQPVLVEAGLEIKAGVELGAVVLVDAVGARFEVVGAGRDVRKRAAGLHHVDFIIPIVGVRGIEHPEGWPHALTRRQLGPPPHDAEAELKFVRGVQFSRSVAVELRIVEAHRVGHGLAPGLNLQHAVVHRHIVRRVVLAFAIDGSCLKPRREGLIEPLRFHPPTIAGALIPSIDPGGDVPLADVHRGRFKLVIPDQPVPGHIEFRVGQPG